MLGRDDDYVSGLERAHHVYLEAGEQLRAVRCAFWIGINLILRGQMGGASGWLGRARRLVEREGRDCVERGYLLLPLMFEHEAAGDRDAAIATGARLSRSANASAIRTCSPWRLRTKASSWSSRGG